MATFYPQSQSNESFPQQWQRYLHDKPLINNIEDIVKTQTNDYKAIIESSTRDEIRAIEQSTRNICGSLDSGFEMLSDNLQELSYGIGDLRTEVNEMASMLDWKLSLFIEQQRISILLLGNVALLLRIPDIQKERQYHIEQGIKFLKNSFFDSDFFEDALKNLLKAENIEPSDFFALHRIGLIYMYSPNHLNLTKAEEYFRKAAKYAVAETNSGASLTINHLSGNTSRDLQSQILTAESIKLQAAESYMFAGRACYIQGKFGDAAELAGKGFSLVPSMVEAGFTQAKALSANNEVREAASVLHSVITRDRYYSIKTISDLDLIPRSEIQDVLEKLRQEAISDASNLLSDCKRSMISQSMVKEEVAQIETLIAKETYLHCKKAIDLINKKKSRVFSEIFQSKNSNYKENRNLNDLQKLLPEIRDKVKYPYSYLPKLQQLFTYLTENTQWNFPQSSISSELIFINNYQSKTLDSTLPVFLSMENKYFNNLPKVKIQIENELKDIYSDDFRRRNDDDSEAEKARRLIQNRKNKNSVFWAFEGIRRGGFSGAVLGLVVGFFRSCNFNASYTETLFKKGQFWPTVLIMVIIGAGIGALWGAVKGQDE